MIDTNNILGKKLSSISTVNDLIKSKYNGTYKSKLSKLIPDEFEMFQNYPNPFNPVTQIKFNIPERSFVELTVYNILGQKVATLKNEIIDAGSYSVPFDASKLPSGVYVYNLFAQPFGQKSNFNKSAKMMLLK